MKVTTDACLFGAWAAREVANFQPEIKTLLDIGTGTGLLTLMMAQQHPTALIDAIETDPDAAEQARENVTNSPWNKNIRVIHGDVNKFSFDKKYDCIISNPPFYENDLRGENIKKNIAHHNEGLLLADLLSIIKKSLQAQGFFYLLLPIKRQEEIKNLFRKNELSIHKLVFVRQSADHDYFRIMLAGRLNNDGVNETTIEEIAIMGANNEYTDGFKELLKDYYLYL